MKFSVDQLLQQGIEAHKTGQLRDAERLYRSILRKKPDHPDANHNLGVLTLGLDMPELSLPYFEAALEANPRQEQYWLSMIEALIKDGQFDNASEIIQQGRDNGLDEDKADQLARLLESTRNEPTKKQLDTLIALYDQGQLEALVKQANSLLDQFPAAILLHNILGGANAGLGHFDAAIENYRRAIEIKPDYAETHNNLGIALKDKGDLGSAIESYNRAIEIKPDYAEAHSNLGNALKQNGDLRTAIQSFNKAIAINKDFAQAHNNLGIALLESGDSRGAIENCTRALEIKPDYAEAHSNLGDALQENDDLKASIASYNRALGIKPEFTLARSHKLRQQALICDWGAIEQDRDLIPGLGISTDFVTPFAMLYLEDHPARHLKRAQVFAQHKCKGKDSALAVLDRPSKQPERLRIGYFSGDFDAHPVMRLLVKMFELHDRSALEIHAFSFGPDTSSDMRKRLVKSFDAFHNLREMPDQDIAELARSKGIDVAVDLTGYTQNGRWGIFACRAAPVQVSYLGYPGSMGADFIDYIIADQTLIPEQSRRFYSEKIVYMPHCYQVSDNSRQTSDSSITRAELGLPEAGFVFCCFNTNLKITTREFDIWMRLLTRIEGSILWLQRSNQWSEENLKKEAQDRGVDPGRLVFAEKCDYSDYLMRLTKADLFLDTFNFNAGAMANDALWSGLPVLTLQGQSYVARMASSLLTAINLSEMIAGTEDDYEQLALDLAGNPEKLESIKARLNTMRESSLLFDTEQFTKDIETAYRRMYDRYFTDENPDHLFINKQQPVQGNPVPPGPADSPAKEQIDALVTLYNQGQFEEVVSQAGTLSEQFPRSIFLHNILGGANTGLGRIDAAIVNYKRAIEIKPDYAEAHGNLGGALQEKGDLTAAIASYNFAIKINPDYAEAHSNLGNALLAEGNRTAAIASYTRAIEINPDFASSSQQSRWRAAGKRRSYRCNRKPTTSD